MSYLKLYPKWRISIPLAFIIIFLVSAVSFAQSKVAQYSLGKYNTDKYEEFAFGLRVEKEQGFIIPTARITGTYLFNTWA